MSELGVARAEDHVREGQVGSCQRHEPDDPRGDRPAPPHLRPRGTPHRIHAAPAYDDEMTRVGIAVAALAAFALLVPQAALAQDKGAVAPQAALPQQGTTVGFWAGEAVPGADWESPDTYWNRRSTRLYTPELWSVLSEDHIPLYFNLRYRRDFGPVPPGQAPPHGGAGDHPRSQSARRAGLGLGPDPLHGGLLGLGGRGRRGVPRGQVAPELDADGGRSAARDGARPGAPARHALRCECGDHGRRRRRRVLLAPPQTIDPARQCSAWNRYRHISDWAERHHVTLSAAPGTAALDDLDDGNLALQDASKFIVPEAHWHELFFQAYRSIFAYYAEPSRGPARLLLPSLGSESVRQRGPDQPRLGRPWQLQALLEPRPRCPPGGDARRPGPADLLSGEDPEVIWRPASGVRLVHAARHPFDRR